MFSMHDEIFEFLFELHKSDKNFLFVPRRTNYRSRLYKGFWFLGNDDYLKVSFWNGADPKEKFHNIGFVVTANGSSYIEISAEDDEEKADFLYMLVEQLGDFEKEGKKNAWHRQYRGRDYIANLKDFLKNEKPVIDAMIKKHKPKGITLPDKTVIEDIERVIKLRKVRK